MSGFASFKNTELLSGSNSGDTHEPSGFAAEKTKYVAEKVRAACETDTRSPHLMGKLQSGKIQTHICYICI